MERTGAPTSTTIDLPAGSWAAAAPVLCAAHCIATPLLVLLSPTFHMTPAVEYAVMGAAALLAIAFLAWGVAAHGRAVVWIPVIAGLVVWIGGEATFGHSAGGLWLHVAGSILLAGGLIWNAFLRHEATCRDCGCPAHEEESRSGQPV